MSDRPLVQVGQRGTSVFADLSRLRAEFAACSYLHLPHFFSDWLVRAIGRDLGAANFHPREHSGVGRELCLGDSIAAGALAILMNDPTLLDAMQTMTATPPFRSFVGRIFQMRPDSDDYDQWHDDLGDAAAPRRLALSVNLGGPYEGGHLLIRERASHRIVAEVANLRAGDAVVFRIDPTIQHRIDAVTGSAPRIAYAGWFIDSVAPLPARGERVARSAG